MKTKTHKDKELRFSAKQPKLASFGYSSVKDASTKDKIMDIQISTYVAAHSSIRSIDHLTEVLKTCGIGSPLQNIQLHRSKCSAIIKNVLEPAMRKELIEEVGDQSYSIILDESTDVTIEKYMAYCIRYYNSKLDKIVVDFLGFQEVFEATADALYKSFKSFISKMGLNLQKLIALGTDGASNLCGKHHSLFTLLQADIPHLQLLKCVCHSLSLCASKACSELPSCLEYLLRETRNWFAHSPLRMKIYQTLFETINDGKKPLKLTQLSATRWLAFYEAIKTNINQWLELKTHFNMVQSLERCYTARELAAMYNDDTNLLYLLFLCSILKEVTNVNIIFQANDANITKIYSDLRILLVATARRVFKPIFLRIQNQSENVSLTMLHEADIISIKRALDKADAPIENSLLPLDSIDFGEKFNDLLAKKTVSAEKAKEIKQRCTGFLVRLIKELVDRLPLNVSVVEKNQLLDPRHVCLSNSKPRIEEFPWQLGDPNIDREAIINQWHILSTMRMEEIIGTTASPNNVEHFWIEVLKMKNAGGNLMFKDLAEFSIRCLSLPLSNAVVERIFSVMGTIKTKLRNRMQLPMLIAILRIRTHMNVRGICCNSFQPSDHMISLHAGRKMYASSGPSASSSATTSTATDDAENLEDALLLLTEDESQS